MTVTTGSRLDHHVSDTQRAFVEPSQTTPQAEAAMSPNGSLPAGSQTAPSTDPVLPPKGASSTEHHTSTPVITRLTPRGDLPVVDPLLFVHVTTLGDLEQQRIASENRLRTLTTTEPDEDGVMRGFGLTLDHPDVARLAGITDALRGLEHDAMLGMNRSLRRSAIYPWIKAQRGIGDKQAARLLGAISDPYWHMAADRPRTVSELWAYCGLHVLPASHIKGDTHPTSAGGDQPPADQICTDTRDGLVGGTHSSDPGLGATDAHTCYAGVAARRRKGQRANWSTEAKTRAWVCIESCMKQLDPECKNPDSGIAKHVTGCTCSPYRIVVDTRRIHTTVTHPDWTPKHSQMDGMRVASKELLKHLWRESKRLRGDAA